MIEPSDIKSILQEPDGEELYRTATETKRAMVHHQQAPQVDVDAEWKKFAAAHPRRKSFSLRVIAASAVFAICLVVAAITLPHVFGHQPVEESGQPSLAAKEQPAVADTFVFHDIPLREVLDEIAAHYEAQVTCHDQHLLEMHLYTQIDKSLTLPEVIRLLNHFDNVNIRLEGSDQIIVE